MSIRKNKPVVKAIKPDRPTKRFIGTNKPRKEKVAKTNVPYIPLHKDTIEVKDYTRTHTIYKFKNSKGNLKIELKDTATGDSVYIAYCKSSESFLKQVKYVNRSYGKHNISTQIQEHDLEFDYPPKVSTGNIKPDKVLPEKKFKDTKVIKEMTVTQKKAQVISNILNLVPEYVGKGVTPKIKHNSTEIITATLEVDFSVSGLQEGEHIIKVNYETKEAAYYFNGKYIRTKPSLLKLLK